MRRLLDEPLHLKFDFFFTVAAFVFDVDDCVRRNGDSFACHLNTKSFAFFNALRQASQLGSEPLRGISFLYITLPF